MTNIILEDVQKIAVTCCAIRGKAKAISLGKQSCELMAQLLNIAQIVTIIPTKINSVLNGIPYKFPSMNLRKMSD